MDKFILYFFMDEKKNPFYVGFTKNFKQRMKNHMYEVRYGNRLPKYHKFRKVLATGLRPDEIMVPVEENIPPSKIEQKEIEYIKKIRKNGGKLYNLTDGGRGKIATIPGIRKLVSRVQRSRTMSEETRRRISEARKGMVFSKEHKRHLSIARKKRKTTLETRRKMHLSAKGKINIKIFKLVSPSGKEFLTTEGLTKFCEDHGLAASNMQKVIQGKREHHKGWKGYRT